MCLRGEGALGCTKTPYTTIGMNQESRVRESGVRKIQSVLRAVCTYLSPCGRGREDTSHRRVDERVRGVLDQIDFHLLMLDFCGQIPLTRHYAYAHGDLSHKGRGSNSLNALII